MYRRLEQSVSEAILGTRLSAMKRLEDRFRESFGNLYDRKNSPVARDATVGDFLDFITSPAMNLRYEDVKFSWPGPLSVYADDYIAVIRAHDRYRAQCLAALPTRFEGKEHSFKVLAFEQQRFFDVYGPVLIALASMHGRHFEGDPQITPAPLPASAAQPSVPMPEIYA